MWAAGGGRSGEKREVVVVVVTGRVVGGLGGFERGETKGSGRAVWVGQVLVTAGDLVGVL